MTDITETTIEAPVERKRLGWPKGKKRGKRVETKVPEEFAGLTAVNCCDACKPGACVISGSWVCAHPNKSAFRSNDSKVWARYQRAKKALAHQKIDLRGAA